MKTTCRILVSLLSLAPAALIWPVSAAPPVADFSAGLIGYWPFDESSGLTAADASSFGNNGSLSNFTGNAQWVPGRVGGAIEFGGATPAQFVRVPNYPKTIATTMTAAAWVWADDRTSWGTIIKNWGGTSPFFGQLHFGQYGDQGDLSAIIEQQDAVQVTIREGSGNPVPLSQWVHIVFVADGSNLWLCRNGKITAGPVPYNGTITNPPPRQELGIGAKLDNAGIMPPESAQNPGFWNGKLDEVALWNRALTPCECQALYQAGLGGTNLLDPNIGFDTTPPVVSCSTNITVAPPPGSCFGTTPVTYQVSVSDASTAVVICEPESGSSFPVGTTRVLCAGVDACNNESHCSFTITVGTPPCVPVQATTVQKMVLWLPLDERTGTTARNLVPGAPNGVHHGNPTQLPGENVMGALRFDGTDDYVDVPNYGALGAANFGIEAWIRRLPGSTGRRVIASRIPTASRGFEFYLDNGVLKLDFPGLSGTRNSMTMIPDDNKWHHVAAFYKRQSNGRVSFFVDGQEVAQITPVAPATLQFATGLGFRVGAGTYPTPNSFFLGDIDEVVFYNDGFAEEDPERIFLAGRSGRCRIECRVPWDTYFDSTNNGATYSFPAVFVNNTASSNTMQWFASGPMTFLQTNGTVTVPPFGSVTQTVSFLPPTQTNPRYFLTLVPEGGCPIVCEGQTWYTHGVRPSGPFIVNVPGSGGQVISVTLSNVPRCRTITASAMGPNMLPDGSVISFNGEPPGTPVTFNTPCPAPDGGEGGEMRTDETITMVIKFNEPFPNVPYTILYNGDMDGDGTLETLISVAVQNTPAMPPKVTVIRDGHEITVTWEDKGDGLGVLESAPSPDGPWTAIPGAMPGYSTFVSEQNQYFRVLVP